MKTTTVISWAALGTLAVLGTVSLGSAPAGYWAPEGFVARADTLIQRGALGLLCADQDSIVTRFQPGSDEEAFFAASYLRADVRAFNAGPDVGRSPFLVDGCRLVGVDPFYHRVDLPYNRLPRWRGDVLFTFQGRTATLEGAASQELEVRYPLDRKDAAVSSTRVSPAQEGARVRTALLRLTAPGSREVLADAFFVGDAPVLADRRDVGSTDVLRVNGFRTPPGRMLRLEPGDWLQVADAGGAAAASDRGRTTGGVWTYLAETDDRARTASFVRVRNDRVERLFPATRLRPVLEPFGRAMDLALQTIPGGSSTSLTEADVRLTLDREMTDALDAVLADWCRERAHPTRPRAASFLVMDGFTGKVRAMPSCPGSAELAAWEPLSARTRERFLRNQNLVPHPVGSAAKPFWTAAVATTWPNMLDLEIPAHAPGPVGAVLGCPLPAPYGDGHGSSAWTGLETFLQRSCNRYVVQMASAALVLGSGTAAQTCRGPLSGAAFARCFPPARSASGQDSRPSEAASSEDSTRLLRFCDAVVATALAPGLEVVGGRCDDLQLVDAEFVPGPALAGLTNVAVYREPSPDLRQARRTSALGDQYRLGRYRVDAWRTVLDRLSAAGDTADVVRTALRFAGASPQATNLALNTVEELRTDWVNLLLGGENSRWSNFELAEATARLMTGRAVRGTLADSVSLPGGADVPAEEVPQLDDATLRAGVRRRVLHAMELVARPGGTAGRLEPALARLRERLRDAGGRTPYELYAFAKTGTPAVETFVSSAQQRMVRDLQASGDLTWNGRTFVLRPSREDDIRRTLGAGTLRWLRDDVLAPMERDPAAFRARPGEPLPSHPLYFGADGSLRARELAERRVERQGGVLLLGLLAVPADQGRRRAAAVDAWVSACSLDPDLRRGILEVPPRGLLDPERDVALSVAIYLDDLAPGEGSGSAVDLAIRSLDELGDDMVREVRRRVQGG